MLLRVFNIVLLCGIGYLIVVKWKKNGLYTFYVSIVLVYMIMWSYLAHYVFSSQEHLPRLISVLAHDGGDSTQYFFYNSSCSVLYDIICFIISYMYNLLLHD